MFPIKDAIPSALRGREAFSLKAGELPTGAPYLIPVMAISAGVPGPTLMVHTGMHGDEVLGAEIVREVWRRTEPRAITGRIILVPSSNLPAMSVRERTNPAEIYPGPQDLNRVFPGDAEGSLTERVAHLLVDRLLSQADYLIDIHTPAAGAEWQPYASVPTEDAGAEYRDRALEFARAFGAPVLLEGSLHQGTIQSAAQGLGKVAMTVEVGEANRYSQDLLEWGVGGVQNTMHHIGITSGRAVPSSESILITRLHRVRANRGGFLHLDVQPGDDVDAGTHIGSILNMASEVIEVITAPVAGRVLRVNRNALAGTGDLVVYIGAS